MGEVEEVQEEEFGGELSCEEEKMGWDFVMGGVEQACGKRRANILVKGMEGEGGAGGRDGG